MKKQTETLRGRDGFDSYYKEVFKDDWESLRSALLGECVYARLEYAGMEPYFLDPASVCAALALPVKDSCGVLDMCAAPGGKSLVLAGGLRDGASLHANERSHQRKIRLDTVLKQSLPESVLSSVRTTCSDAAVMCRRKDLCYGSILLDAPCSSERHVLSDPRYLSLWSPSRIKNLSMEQWALLSSAWRMLSPGGALVYSTCALSPSENDGVLERLSRKFPDVYFASEDEVMDVIAESAADFRGTLCFPCGMELTDFLKDAVRTERGLHFLPHIARGAGPLFFSLMYKKS